MLDSAQVWRQIQTMLKMSPQPKSPNSFKNETGELSSLSSSHLIDQVSSLNTQQKQPVILTHESNMSQTRVANANSLIIQEDFRQDYKAYSHIR